MNWLVLGFWCILYFGQSLFEPISDQEAFFVEVSVPPAHTETPESVDTGNCSFSAQSNFSQKEAQFGAIRPYNLFRGDHLALER